MEEFIQALLQLVYNGQAPDMNKVQYTEDEDGTVTIKYQKHNYKAELQAFKDYIDTLSDDIFEKSSARFSSSRIIFGFSRDSVLFSLSHLLSRMMYGFPE